MSDLNAEEYYETESSDNEENHSNLLSSISQLDSTQRVKPAQRKEPALRVSEYDLTDRIASEKNLISLNELADVLGKSSKHGIVTNKLKSVTSKSGTLPKPLEKPLADQIKRSLGFENVVKQLKRWNAIVTRNAVKDQLKFPLNDNSMKMQKSDEFLSQFQCSTPLEEEIMKVLKPNNTEEKQEENEFTLTLEEMLEKRKEMAYLRAKLSYKAAKAHRQNKIKSKKYHRILRREKLKQQLKDFELLQKTDPEAALKKLEELDKTRAIERASLRHRNTGHWAKNMTVRAKYDIESRKILAEQLKLSRELTEKVHALDDSDKEEPEGPIPLSALNRNAKFKTADKFVENPWNIKIAEEVEDFVSGYKKYWNEQNKTIKDSTNKNAGENLEKCVKISKEINEDFSKSHTEMQKLPHNDLVKTNTEIQESLQSEGIKTNPEIQESLQSEVIKTNAEVQESLQSEVIKTNAEVQKPLQSDLIKPKKNKKKKSEESNVFQKSASVSIYPGSGVWIVTPVNHESDVKIQKKKKGENIDSLFEELDEQLMEKAKSKINEIKNSLKGKKNTEKSPVKKNTKSEFDLSLKNKSMVERPDMDVGLLEGDDINLGDLPKENAVDQTAINNVSTKIMTDIDPNNYIQVKPKRLRTSLPDNANNEEGNIDDDKRHVMTIEEAFVDDDVIAEFKEMKEDTEKIKEIEIKTSLPGWGEWGGLGIVPKKRKKSRLVVKVPPRKDKGKKDTIINENANSNLKNHMVKDVPHPFQSVEAFEANIRAPVGREWVPETAHWKLIQKQVETKMGAVIDPMDEDELVRQKKNHKSLYKGKIKNQGRKLHKRKI